MEYDSGGYEVARIDAHVLAYAELGAQLWVASTAARAELILSRLDALVPERADHRVLVGRWW